MHMGPHTKPATHIEKKITLQMNQSAGEVPIGYIHQDSNVGVLTVQSL